jgi:hypothetical protein
VRFLELVGSLALFVAGVDELLGHDAKLLPDVANLVVQSRQPVEAVVNGWVEDSRCDRSISEVGGSQARMR